MAYRRSISTRVILLTRRIHPSFGYISHEDDTKTQPTTAGSSRCITSNFLEQGYNYRNTSNLFSGYGSLSRVGGCSSFSFLPGIGSSSRSYSSSTIGGGSDKVQYMGDVAGILTDPSVEAAVSQAPIASEVAIAAADSYFPVAALQYMIDGVHNLTGLNWWASIALTTLFIRVAIIPLSINQIKSTSKLALMKPQLEEIKEKMADMASDPKTFNEGQKQMKALFKEHGVTPFTPLKGLLIQGPIFISFFMAINNMVEKVPSFKEGGAFWFTDLTVPDSLYIFPVLTSLAFLITVECNMQEGMEGNAAAGTMKNFSRIIAVLTVPFTMSFPKAIFCYWITSNCFSLVYGLVIKRPQVKKLLGLPEIPVTQPTTSSKSSFNPFSFFNTAKTPPAASVAAASIEPLKVAQRKLTPSSVMSQHIKDLEKQVKGRKKNKKR